MIQDAVKGLCEILLKLTDKLEATQLDAAAELVDAFVRPLSCDDIRVLMRLLPAEGDTAFGLNWIVLHAIEESLNWPLWDTLEDKDSEWVSTFLRRLANAGIERPSMIN